MSAAAVVGDEPWEGMSPSEFLSPYHDAVALLRLLSTELRQVITKCISASFPESNAEIISRINDALDEGLVQLQNAKLQTEAVFIGGATQSCCGALKQLYGVMASVRQSSSSSSSTKKPANIVPAPSFWVSNVFETLRVLFDASTSLASTEDRAAWALQVTSAVFDKCTEICGELMMTLSRTDDVMLKMSSSPEQLQQQAERSDTDRFLQQLAIDV
jgi:hypothetical protein